MNLVALLLPLFLIAGTGCLLARTRWILPAWQDGLADLTAKLLIPVFLFAGAYRNGLPGSVSWQFLAAYYVPFVLLFGMAFFAFRRNAGSALSAIYSNTVFVGVPVLVQAYDKDILQYVFPIIAFHALIGFTLYFLAEGGKRIGDALLNTLKNPIVVSLMAGLALNLTGVVFPLAATSVIDLLSAATLPCALLTLGASLANLHVKNIGASLGIVFAKLFMLPAGVYALAALVFDLPAHATAALVIIAACPVGVNTAAVVRADGKDASLSSSAILLSSVACIATIPIWLWIVRA
ncbi:MAG: AEC family transporter [Pseudomonadota bacterium]